MMNIVLTGLVAGLAVTVALLARDRNRYYTISNETIKELAILEKEYDELDAMVLKAGAEIMALEADRDYWRDMAVEITDIYVDEVMGDIPEPTIGENISMNYVEQLCHITGLDNPLADIDRDKCLKDLTEEEWEAMRILKEELPVRFANIEWEEDDADDYYNDIFRELMGELNCMI
jgi:hypothetical protein